MKKFFISVPMNGKSDEQIKADMEQAKRKIIDEYGIDVEFIDSFFDDSEIEDPVEMLGKSIFLMAKADVVYFCEGWESARGCRIEHEVAIAYDKECING